MAIDVRRSSLQRSALIGSTLDARRRRIAIELLEFFEADIGMIEKRAVIGD